MLPKPLLTVSSKATPGYKTLKREWMECKKCPLHKTRYKVVNIRGHLPADILFIGEAPGESENQMGFPFVGEAGHKLQNLIDISLQRAFRPKTDCDLPVDPEEEILDKPDYPIYAIANVIGCFPWDEELGKIRPPSVKEINSCLPRINKLIKICNPKLVVFLGVISHPILASLNLPTIEYPCSSCKDGYTHPSKDKRGYTCNQCEGTKRIIENIPTLSLVHPSHIIRQVDSGRKIDLLSREFITSLSNKMEKVFN